MDAAAAKLSSLGFDAAGAEALEAARGEQAAAVRAARDAVEALAAKVRVWRRACRGEGSTCRRLRLGALA